jgi:hypothetical protein
LLRQLMTNRWRNTLRVCSDDRIWRESEWGGEYTKAIYIQQRTN